MRLKHRPWRLVAAAFFFTLIVVVGGADLLDGTVHFRHRVIAMSTDPNRFGLYVLGWLGAIAVAGLAWIGLIDEWNRDYTPRWRPRFDDPTRRRFARRGERWPDPRK